MADSLYDVLGLGNAIVDVLARADDAFLVRHGFNKGAMHLIDEETAHRIYGDMGAGIEASGGSAANSMAGIASMGGRAAFVGKVRDDQLGSIFAHDIRSVGVHFDTPFATSGPSTARCLILVTPDGERTMNTYLGACVELGPEDIDEKQVTAAKVTYMEGYLWDKQSAKEAFLKAAAMAHTAGREIALSLSDPFCVERHRDEFRNLVTSQVDVLLANEDEIKSLYQQDHFDDALQLVRKDCALAVLTRSEAGAVVVRGDEVHVVSAVPVEEVIDATGAGDLFAAGFLYGHTNGYDLAGCARLGAAAAAEVIGHFGARPETDLRSLVLAAG
jgi:sugar/nucleoside kinase (ribokinase family)